MTHKKRRRTNERKYESKFTRQCKYHINSKKIQIIIIYHLIETKSYACHTYKFNIYFLKGFRYL